ncbi:MAG TPA: HemK2/MTQ2 family protein methyltransferase [Solirubrobacteraceae bacterium]|nr:HemK2/MTQ2 family protein methyltransferase [Solirubrobacteraceae bacterium]
MRLVTLPGVFSPISDSRMLADALREQTLPPHASVLDVCTGSGLLAVSAALRGARDVTAVDVSRRAVLTARLNARLNGVRVRALRGWLFEPVGGRRFDAIVSNPPYVPADDDELPARGVRRAWDAGRDGRVLLDRLLDEAPAHLRPGGFLLVVHSSVIGRAETLRRMAAGGLEPDVVGRRRGPLGPLLTARAAALEARGLLAPGQRHEDVLVFRARAPWRRGAGAAKRGAEECGKPHCAR